MARPTVAYINQAAFNSNVQVLEKQSSGAELVLVVKADAYGHGVQNLLTCFDGKRLAVSCAEEALTLFDLGFSGTVVLLEGPFNAECVHSLAGRDVVFVIHRPEQIGFLLGANYSAKVWLKLDTGMHRLGLDEKRLQEVLSTIAQSQTISIELVMTHFACADDRRNPSFKRQHQAFTDLCQRYSLSNHPISLCNSAALLLSPELHGDVVRAGIALYGANPAPLIGRLSQDLRPVMSLKSEVIALRDVDSGETVGYGDAWTALRPSTIATVAIGYGDGYPRHAPSGTPVYVNCKRALLAGRVSMDMITVDVTEIKDVSVGDEVELWGDRLPIEEVAEVVGTISYELCTGLTTRVPRITI